MIRKPNSERGDERAIGGDALSEVGEAGEKLATCDRVRSSVV